MGSACGISRRGSVICLASDFVFSVRFSFGFRFRCRAYCGSDNRSSSCSSSSHRTCHNNRTRKLIGAFRRVSRETRIGWMGSDRVALAPISAAPIVCTVVFFGTQRRSANGRGRVFFIFLIIIAIAKMVHSQCCRTDRCGSHSGSACFGQRTEQRFVIVFVVRSISEVKITLAFPV